MWETTTLGSILGQEPLNEIYLNAEAIKETLAEADGESQPKRTVFGKPFAMMGEEKRGVKDAKLV